MRRKIRTSWESSVAGRESSGDGLENDVAVVVFTDAVGLGALRPVVVNMTMTAVLAMVQWLAGERALWTFCFNHAAPRFPEQHEAYLGSALRFGCLAHAMLVPTVWLDRPWPPAASVDAAVSPVAASRAAAHEGHPERSLLALLHDCLLATLRESPELDAAASALGTSAATLKRRLAAEGKHFQAELDLVRSRVPLQHYRFRSADNAAVAQALGFGDARASPGGGIERRLDSADREFACRLRLAATAAKPTLQFTLGSHFYTGWSPGIAASASISARTPGSNPRWVA